jgi:RNA polymerase sigma-70 factor (ECF subfamily)
MWMAAERTLGSQSDAGDIVHAVFLKLPKIALSYDGRADARAWLAGIVVRVALRQRRGLGRFVKMLSRLTSIPSERSATPEAVASVRQELDRFQTALDALSPKKRAVFVLIELEGLTTDEASRALGIPPGTIRTRLHHARQELHDSVMRGREA